MNRSRLFPLGGILLLAIAVVLAALPPAMAQGTPDLKTYPAPDFKDQAYLQKLHQKVGTSWKRPQESPEPPAKAVVIATFLRDGSLLEARLHHKSGSGAWDASAMAAVKNAAPVDPLPEQYKRTSLEVHFHFEIN